MPGIFADSKLIYADNQKTALSDGSLVTVVSKPTIASPAVVSSYQKISILSSYQNAPVERRGFEPPLSAREAVSLPLAYRPVTGATTLLQKIIFRTI